MKETEKELKELQDAYNIAMSEIARLRMLLGYDTPSTLNTPKGCGAKYYKNNKYMFKCDGISFLCKECQEQSEDAPSQIKKELDKDYTLEQQGELK